MGAIGRRNLSKPSIDLGEFLRFFVTGVTATVGNLTCVSIARTAVPYQAALLVGVTVGFAISFIMSKVFAFRSKSWTDTRGEFTRFLMVYGVGILCYWSIAMVAGHIILSRLIPLSYAEIGGAFLGAASMTFTSYFGHRFFTYRSTFQEQVS